MDLIFIIIHFWVKIALKLIYIIIKSIIKSIVYLSFQYRYWYQLYGTVPIQSDTWRWEIFLCYKEIGKMQIVWKHRICGILIFLEGYQ